MNKRCFVLLSLIFSLLFVLSLKKPLPEKKLFRKIIISYKHKSYKNCIKYSGQYIRMYPKGENIIMVKLVLANSHLNTGEKAKAIEILKAHNLDYPDYEKNDQVKFLLGKLYYKEKQYKDSKTILKEIIVSFPESSYVSEASNIIEHIYKKGFLNKEDEELEDLKRLYSEKRYQMIILREPDYLTKSQKHADAVLFMVGDSFIQVSDLTNGRIRLERVIKEYPGSEYSLKSKKILEKLKTPVK
ncbi:MAG: outer membrane protein assembly factor BamD [Spirochaetes bacterium]|nr:outer membrane protein assembly factor BamD [Spirochaetota bacterium]